MRPAKGTLKRHINTVHDKLRNHVCDECEFAASQKSNLRRHKEEVHSVGDKKFKCAQCPYQTTLRGSLQVHIEGMHDNIRKYVCEDCGYAAKLQGIT